MSAEIFFLKISIQRRSKLDDRVEMVLQKVAAVYIQHSQVQTTATKGVKKGLK